MELRQLRYFVRVVELGSFSQAAAALGVVTSTLSQQVSRLESELATRLLQRTSTGVRATDAGLAFWRQAQLALRHANEAARAARTARLAGHVAVGLAPTTASVLGLPLMAAMRERYPDVRLHLVESLSGHLGDMLRTRQIDLAVLFHLDDRARWSVTPLLHERLFLIGARGRSAEPSHGAVSLRELGDVPLLLPSAPHGLRALIEQAFARARLRPRIAAEIDGLSLLMDAVAAGHGATIQPGAATARLALQDFRVRALRDRHARRPNLLASLSDDELSPAGLAARVVMGEVARRLVAEGRWPGATLASSGAA